MSQSATEKVYLVPENVAHRWANTSYTVLARLEHQYDHAHMPREVFAEGDEGDEYWQKLGQVVETMGLALLALTRVRDELVSAFMPNDPVAVEARSFPATGLPFLVREVED